MKKNPSGFKADLFVPVTYGIPKSSQDILSNLIPLKERFKKFGLDVTMKAIL